MARFRKRPRTAFFGSLISPCPQSKPSCRATGPFSQQKGVHACVEASGRRKSPTFIASTNATRSGMNSGGHPAITPFAATWRTVTFRCAGGIAPSEWSGFRSVNLRNSATAASVGGIIGSPSVAIANSTFSILHFSFPTSPALSAAKARSAYLPAIPPACGLRMRLDILRRIGSTIQRTPPRSVPV